MSKDTENYNVRQSSGYVLVRLVKGHIDTWLNYKFYAENGKYSFYWADDPFNARVWGNTFLNEQVSGVHLSCHPGYLYFFVQVKTDYQEELTLRLTKICQWDCV